MRKIILAGEARSERLEAECLDDGGVVFRGYEIAPRGIDKLRERIYLTLTAEQIAAVWPKGTRLWALILL